MRRLFYCMSIVGACVCLLLNWETVHAEKPLFVAHAGGGYENRTYTNSLEALNANYNKGHRYFEVDFNWTSDGKLVAIHDWENSLEKRFPQGARQGKTPTEEEFLNFRSRDGLTQLSFSQVVSWARSRQDVVIVTDIKERNIDALKWVRDRFPEDIAFIVPQVYSYSEYPLAKGLGFKNVILTLYMMSIQLEEVFFFAKENRPYAITMHRNIAMNSPLPVLLKNLRVTAYAHTVNDMQEVAKLRQRGVYGVYTDFLVPP